MKKYLLNLIMLVIPALVAIQAQAPMTKGSVKLEITDVTTADPNAGQMAQMMKGATSEIFFDGDESITRTSIMGGMVTTDVQMDKANNKMDMYMDMMGQKVWIQSTLDEAQKAKSGMSNLDIKSDKSNTKTINGLEAFAITITDKTNPKLLISGFVTEAIKASTEGIQGMEGLELPGFPLEIVIEMKGQMSMTMKAVDIKKEVDASVFTKDTAGYQKMTMEEFQKSMGGMGGLGF